MDDARQYLKKTLRAVVILMLCSVTLLANFGLNWAIVPVLLGLGVAVLLLLAWWLLTNAILAGASRLGISGEKRKEKKRARVLILLVALVKYPMVAALLWRLTHVWALRELYAFVVGFLLLHVVIALRAVGKLLNEHPVIK